MRMARNSFGLPVVGLVVLFAGCSDPVPPAAQAAASIHFGKTTTDLCIPGVHWSNAPYQPSGGQVTSGTGSPTNKLIDGENGGEVSCTVRANGGGFRVEASLTAPGEFNSKPVQPTTMNLSVQIAPDQSDAVGTLSVADDKTAATYGSSDCKFSVTGEPKLSISDGRVWGKVTCDHLADPGTASGATCRVEGYFVLENCAQ